jgi:hypothetical protein
MRRIVMAVTKRINGKNKGNVFERKISISFSKRFEIKTGIKNSFRRNADSGSFFGGTNQKRVSNYDIAKATFGDIICPNDFRYSIECKHYKSPPSFSDIMSQSVKDWDTWIKQAKADSINANKLMMIVIKYNRVDEIVILDNEVEGCYNIKYKDYFVVSLDELLKKEDDYFFNKG